MRILILQSSACIDLGSNRAYNIPCVRYGKFYNTMDSDLILFSMAVVDRSEEVNKLPRIYLVRNEEYILQSRLIKMFQQSLRQATYIVFLFLSNLVDIFA